MTKKPKVSVCCLSYNQEKYIRQTLDGFVMQKTNFAFEVLIHDDASTDSTPDIIREYQAKYPDIIKPILQTENQFAKQICPSTTFNFPRIQGEYVAICEGDDYWTDENKLQRQVDFLDANPNFSICFHQILVHHEDEPKPDFIYPDLKLGTNEVLQLKHLLKVNFIQTNSVMYRWRFHDCSVLKEVYPRGIIPADWFMHLLHAQVGNIGFIKEIMGVYRRHSKGIWANSYKDLEKLHLDYGVGELKFHLLAEKLFPEYKIVKGTEHTKEFAATLFKLYLKHKRFDKMQEIIKLCPACMQTKVAN